MRRLVIEADGGSRGNPGPAAYGAVVLDAVTGEVLVELADHIGVETNNVAEYEGLAAGLRAAREIDPQARVEARLDSRLVVEQMSGSWAIRNERLRRIALATKALLPADQVRFTWVPRAQNKRADALVNRCLDAVAAGRPARIEQWHRGAGDPDIYVEAVEQVVRDTRRVLAAPAQPTPAVADADLARSPELPVIVGWSRADLGVPTTLALVRHGVTQHSVEHRFSGRNGVDPGLIELGEAQARAAALELARRGGAEVLVTSPLRRTRETAQIIRRELGLEEPVVCDGLAEADFGAWDSLTFGEVQQRWPRELAAWLASSEVAPPGGEAFTAVRRRVSSAHRQLIRRFPRQRIVVVSHTTPIKCLVQSVLDAPASSAYRFELAPGSLTTVGAWADGISTLYGVGEVGHLHGVMHDTA